MPKMSPVNLARYNKLYVAAVTFAGALVSNQVITGRNADVVSAAIGAAGVLGVFVVRNAEDPRVPTPVTYDPAPNVTRDFVAEKFGKPGLGAAGPHRDPLTGRYSKEP